MLSSADMDLGISLEIPQGSHSSNGVDMQVHIPHELEKQCQASFRVEIRISGFFSRCHRSVTTTIVFHSILGVTVKSVQGSQVNLEWIGTSGSFGIVARPLEFLWTFKLRQPPLQVLLERRDSFPNEAGKWSLISR